MFRRVDFENCSVIPALGLLSKEKKKKNTIVFIEFESLPYGHVC